LGGGQDAVRSVRVQLWRLRDADRDGAWAYGWRTTFLRGPGRRSWSHGILLAHPERGVTWLGPDVAGLVTAMAVLADEWRSTGHLPRQVDRWIDDPPDESGLRDARMPGHRKSRYDRYGLHSPPLRHRARATRRPHDDSDGTGGDNPK
jgi:hypothetical protein